MSWREWREFAGVLVTLVLLIAAGLTAAAFFLSRSTPRPHDNASFRYGRRIMDAQIYGDERVTSIDAACRAVLAHPAHPPRNFDFDEAVSGCRYQEFWEDN